MNRKGSEKMNMSSYIVPNETINRILSIESLTPLGTTKLTRMGRKFLKMNTKAVNQKYASNTDKSHDFDTYTFQRVHTSIEQAFYSLSCLIYQCSEGTIPKSKTYKELVKFRNELANRIATREAEKAGAKWG